jgi:deoxyinosine 3'endonuclease (endonuclease V)
LIGGADVGFEQEGEITRAAMVLQLLLLDTECG